MTTIRLASLGAVVAIAAGCGLLGPSEVIRQPELGGKVASETTGPDGNLAFSLTAGSTVTVRPGRTLVLVSPFGGLDQAQLVVWGHIDDTRDWLIAVGAPMADDTTVDGCYRVDLRARLSDGNVIFEHDSALETPQELHLGISLQTATHGNVLVPRSDGTFDERAFCLDSTGNVVKQL